MDLKKLERSWPNKIYCYAQPAEITKNDHG